MEKLVTAKLIFQVGSICLLETLDASLFKRASYYWKFKESTTYYGPFNTMLEAGEHIDAFMRTPPQDAAGQVLTGQTSVATDKIEEQKNVIKIDFRAKRRIK